MSSAHSDSVIFNRLKPQDTSTGAGLAALDDLAGTYPEHFDSNVVPMYVSAGNGQTRFIFSPDVPTFSNYGIREEAHYLSSGIPGIMEQELSSGGKRPVSDFSEYKLLVKGYDVNTERHRKTATHGQVVYFAIDQTRTYKTGESRTLKSVLTDCQSQSMRDTNPCLTADNVDTPTRFWGQQMKLDIPGTFYLYKNSDGTVDEETALADGGLEVCAYITASKE